jgi:DNA-directed RNA polymerase beta' subunit
LDEVKSMGFLYITRPASATAWVTFRFSKGHHHAEGDRKLEKSKTSTRKVLLTKKERYNSDHPRLVRRSWTSCRSIQESLDKEGAVFSMIDSGARGSVGQLTNVVGMKGLVSSSPSGEIIELPIQVIVP